MPYSIVQSNQDWPQDSYPIGAFCVVLFTDEGELVLDDSVTEFGFEPVALGRVYRVNDDGELISYGVARVLTPFYRGKLYESLDDIVANVDQVERYWQSAEAQAQENEVVRNLRRDHYIRQWQNMVILAVIVLLIGIFFIGKLMGYQIHLPWLP